ncbi:hypothetical protein QBC38DRAFT_452009 [Podospora fimiseda]|uniref:Uncharacterized protein n=1 Tax=Podospora fimiseda TaxID=252190 RepID=A0AAN7BXC8_9PEZI|nr:hypothetical protein QBC38DRAFT_452009 [Podospora fimiseda]
MEMDGYGIGGHHRPRDYSFHHHQQYSPFSMPPPYQHQQYQQQEPSRPQRKRKADAPPEHNERLSKRMSLLNLEQSGQKLYVPVEAGNPNAPLDTHPQPHRHHKHHKHTDDDSHMQLDDTKYKVYIHNLDDELSSSSDGESDDGRLIFLSDIEKHLRSNRIPPGVLNPKPDSDLADKQLVLYRIPTSLTVPEEQDSVRKAIIEARARMREQQKPKAESNNALPVQPVATMPAGYVPMDADVPLTQAPGAGGDVSFQQDEDPDAMELD